MVIGAAGVGANCMPQLSFRIFRSFDQRNTIACVFRLTSVSTSNIRLKQQVFFSEFAPSARET